VFEEKTNKTKQNKTKQNNNNNNNNKKNENAFIKMSICQIIYFCFAAFFLQFVFV